jgi:PAS domain S-box-containing protein
VLPPDADEAIGSVQIDAVLDAVPTLVGLLDGSGNVAYVNAIALDVAGATLAELTGVPFWRMPWWSQSAAPAVREATTRALAGETCRLDVAFRNDSVTTLSVELHLTPIVGKDGHVRAVVPFIADIGERSRSRRDLLEMAKMHAASSLRAERMFQLARALTGANDLAAILQRTSKIGGDLVGAAFANIGVVDPETDEIELMNGAGLGAEIDQRWPRVALDRTTPIGTALLSGSPVELGRPDEIAESFPSGAADAVAAGFQALAAYPIRQHRAAIGFAWSHPVEFDDDLRHTLTTVVELVGLGLVRAESSQRDHNVAVQLQRSMLPPSLPPDAHGVRRPGLHPAAGGPRQAPQQLRRRSAGRAVQHDGRRRVRPGQRSAACGLGGTRALGDPA